MPFRRAGYRNLRWFSRGKCYIQYKGQNSPEHQYGQATCWASNSSAKNSLGGLAEKLNVSQQHILTSYTQHILCGIRKCLLVSGRDYPPLHSSHEVTSRAYVQLFTHRG